MKKIKTLSFGLVAALAAVSVVSCKKTENGIGICLASNPQHIDPALNSTVDGATYAVHLFAGLVRYQPGNDGKLELAPDLATSLPTANVLGNGKVSYTFTLRDGIKFSDGTDIKASDVVDSWNRAASHSVTDDKGTESTADDVSYTGTDSDYGYMFEIIDGYSALDDKAEAHTLTAADKFALNVTANDAAKTVTVVVNNDLPYFYEICAFPAYQVLKNASSLDPSGGWAFDYKNIVTSGPYTLSYYEKDVEIKMKKNENYWDAASVKNDELHFVLTDDDSAAYAQFIAKKLALIDNLDSTTVKAESGSSKYHVQGQLGTYFIAWNVNGSLFSGHTEKEKEEIRQGISYLINRKNIVENTTGAGEIPSTGFVGMGLTDPAGGEFVDHNGPEEDGAGWTGDYNDYEGNVAKGLEILKKYYTYNESTGKFTNFPSIDYLFNTNATHNSIAVAIKAQLSNFGITINASNMEWAQAVDKRKKGDYETARHGWLADYNDPISFLDLFTSISGNDDVQLGKGENASYTGYSVQLSDIGNYTNLSGTWSQTYDTLISYIKNEADTATRYRLMHRAETLLMSTGTVTPIYNYVDNWLQQDYLTNVYVSPLGYKYFTWANFNK